MASKKITELDIVTSMTNEDMVYINQNQAIKQIKKSNMPKPKYNAEEVGAVDKNNVATLAEIKTFLGI